MELAMASSKPERDFIRVEDLEHKLVTVVLKQSNGIWAFVGFEKGKDKTEFVDFNDFDSAIGYAREWMKAKKNGDQVIKWDTTPDTKKKKK